MLLDNDDRMAARDTEARNRSTGFEFQALVVLGRWWRFEDLCVVGGVRVAWGQSPICGDAVDVFQQKGPRSARDAPHERSELILSGTLWYYLSLLIFVGLHFWRCLRE